jgi:hypothetical protein
MAETALGMATTLVGSALRVASSAAKEEDEPAAWGARPHLVLYFLPLLSSPRQHKFFLQKRWLNLKGSEPAGRPAYLL